MEETTGKNEPKAAELPYQMKRRAKRQQADTNDLLKAKMAGADKSFKNQKHVDLMAFNASAEDRFIEKVRLMIEKSGRTVIPIAKVYQECSYDLNVSPQTIKRYLVKHSAERAELRVFGKDVMLNPNYKPEDEEEDDDE